MHLRPSRVGILFIPGAPSVRIKRSLRNQIVERATIILQAEDAIALIEIEISAVQFVAMRWAGGKVSVETCNGENKMVVGAGRGRGTHPGGCRAG